MWLTVLFVHAARRDDAWVWLSYGIVLAMSVLLDVYLLLLLLAHVAFICLFHRMRTVLVPFAITSVLANFAVTPFVVAVMGQAHQISWIVPIGRRNDRRCDGSTILRQKHPVRAPVGAGSSRRYCLVALHIDATGAGRSSTVDLGDRLACDTDRPDHHLLGVCSPDLHAALLVFHRTGGGIGLGRLHRRIGS